MNTFFLLGNKFANLNDSKRRLIMLALFFALFPGLLFIILSLLEDIMETNPFIFMAFLFFGLPIAIIATIAYALTDIILKRILTIVTGLFLFYLSIIPLIWFIHAGKEKMFIHSNKPTLEFVSNNLLEEKFSFLEAENFIKKSGLKIRVIDYLKNEDCVVFELQGMMDKCYGIAYSKTGIKPTKNSAGKMVSWKKINGNWYSWATL